MRYFFVTCALVSLAHTGIAVDTTTLDSFVTGALSLPSGLVLRSAPRDEKGEVVLSSKIGRPADSESFYGSRVFEVTEVVKEWGVDLPVGSRAIYLGETGTLILKSSSRAVDDLNGLAATCNLGAGLPSIRSQLSVFSLRVSNLAELPQSLAALKELAGDSWREEFSTTILAKSGQRVHTALSMGKQSLAEDIVSFSEDQTGCLITLETSVAPDWWNMESSTNVRYRGKDSKSGELFEFVFDGVVQLWCGQNQVLQTVQTSIGQYRVLVMRSEFVLPNSFPLSRAKP